MTNAHDMQPLHDLSILDKVTGEPTLLEINHAVTQISTILTPFPCDIPEAKEHGCAWIIVNKTQWLMKNGVDTAVTPPTHPGLYTGTTHASKFAYEQKLKNYDNYKHHFTGATRMLEYIFQAEVFLDLQDDQGLLVGYTPQKLVTHLIENFVLEGDYNTAITEQYRIMREPHDPSLMANVYFNTLQTCQRHLAAVDETCPESTMIRHALTQFEIQSDLTDAVDKWKYPTPANRDTWAKFKTHFGKEIKKVKRGQGTLDKIGIANAVEEQLSTNRVLAENILAQQREMEEMRKELLALQQPMLPQSQANTATTIPPPTPTTTMPDMNTQLMQQMMTMMGNLKDNRAGKPRDNDKNGIRQTRRYKHNNYCWTCGYDVNHTSMTCKWIKDIAKHDKNATYNNTNGGSTRNLHLKPT